MGSYDLSYFWNVMQVKCNTPWEDIFARLHIRRMVLKRPAQIPAEFSLGNNLIIEKNQQKFCHSLIIE